MSAIKKNKSIKKLKPKIIIVEAEMSITRENIYDYFEFKDWEEDEKDEGIDAFTLLQKYDKIGGNDGDTGFDELHEKMCNEIRLNYESFCEERSCMWVEEVKRRSKWVRGETLYGYSREKHYTYNIWWSRDKKNIGCSWVLEADGYISFEFNNGYTRTETKYTKHTNYIRPDCLYNDKNCEEEKIINKCVVCDISVSHCDTGIKCITCKKKMCSVCCCEYSSANQHFEYEGDETGTCVTIKVPCAICRTINEFCV